MFSSRCALWAAAALGALIVAVPSSASADEGSGSFGRWVTDDFGLPAYTYEIDERTAPQAPQQELGGSRAAWHQVGNDAIVANAFNLGYVQFWTQARQAQWTNLYDEAHAHYAGGYGYLKVGDQTYSTTQMDQPAGARVDRDFGIGYTRRALRTGPIAVEDHVYTPFGDDPLALHDVTLTNTSSRTQRAVWWEYWDVNPVVAGANLQRGLAAPAYDAQRRLLTVGQKPLGTDTAPLTMFLGAVDADVAGFETRSEAFFGAGGRAAPSAVTNDDAQDGIAAATDNGQVGATLMALRTPVVLRPHQRVTLRYAYGAAHDDQIPALLQRYRSARDSLERSERQWRDWLPRGDFGRPSYPWMSRELAWSAYSVRSATMYEEACGHKVITEGGNYQYQSGVQLAYRDPLQLVLPMIYASPDIAREVIRYSVQQQDPASGHIPFARRGMCAPLEVFESPDFDLWTILAVAEYVDATRDYAFLDEQVPYLSGGTASVWDHVKLAYAHVEATHNGPHGLYTGNDLDALHLTETTLLTALAAWVEPRLADLAQRRGEDAFAQTVRASAAAAATAVSDRWVADRGWYSRGYQGDAEVGTGVIAGDIQPIALLAGIPDATRAHALVANIRRYLTGIGAPQGPSPIGSALGPAASDPGVTELLNANIPGGSDNSAYYAGGVWFAFNGLLTMGLANYEGVVPDAGAYAWDELTRNTRAKHADAYPDRWNGIISTDDVCAAYYSARPGTCGLSFPRKIAGQNTHQPAWEWLGAIKLIGVQPTVAGYRITPSLPLARASLQLPVLGVRVAPGGIDGYVRPEGGGDFELDVNLTGPHRTVVTTVDGRPVAHRVEGDRVTFTVRGTRAGQKRAWAVIWR